MSRPPRRPDAENGSGSTEQCALDKKLADQAEPGGAHRHADCDFALSRGSAGEQKIRHIGAGNEKHERHNRHENLQWRRELVSKLRKTGGGWSQVDAGMLDVFELLLAGLRADVLTNDLLEEKIRVGARLL